MQRLSKVARIGLFELPTPTSRPEGTPEPSYGTDPGVDRVLGRIVELLRPRCGPIPERELVELATDIFLEGARFGLAWVEERTR